MGRSRYLGLFASTAARPADVAADVESHISLSRELKTLQGQILFAPTESSANELAEALLKLTTVDYVHVLLASSALNAASEEQPTNADAADRKGRNGNAQLHSIRAAAAGVESSAFASAIDLWRAIARREGRKDIASMPTEALVFRALGKRGGRGHDFSSDDAKRAAKAGLTEATGLSGSSDKETSALDVLAQVHCNRFWLGLRLNRQPLAPQPTSGKVAPTRDAQEGDGEKRRAGGGGDEREPPPPCATVSAPPPSATAAPSTAAPSTAARPEHPKPPTADGADAGPPLLSGWVVARLAELGLDRPRDVRDVVAPLWELPLAEQRRRKEAEMSELVASRLQQPAPYDSTHDASCSAVEREPSNAAHCEGVPSEAAPSGGAPSNAAVPSAVPTDRTPPCKVVPPLSGPAALCEPIRGVASSAAPPRNTCELHVGRDRAGRPCCGFRLGVGSSKDGLAVGAADAVPFVPPWMVSVANAMGEAMCNWEQQQQQGSEGATLPWSMLRLRGSLRTREATAVLTPTMAGMHGAMAVSVTRDEAAALEARLICAAATQGQRISAVLVLVRHSGSVDDHASPAVDTVTGSTELRPLVPMSEGGAGGSGNRAAASLGGANDGTIVEELCSGLRLHISPMAFFQASTDAAEVLFRTVVELATEGGRAFPSYLLDLCCGGGVLGLEVARAASAAASLASAGADGGPQAPPTTRVIGIELSPSSVRDAARNAESNGLGAPHYQVMCAAAEDGIAEALQPLQDGAALSEDATPFAVAILDPPRTGLAPAFARHCARRHECSASSLSRATRTATPCGMTTS